MTLFVAIGELRDGNFIEFDDPTIVQGEPAGKKASPGPPIEMFEVDGVWMTFEDARAQRAAASAKQLATPFNSGKW